MKDRKIAALLAFIGGAIGLHKFYLGKVGQGVFYCILCLVTFATLPALLGLIDAAVLMGQDDQTFQEKYAQSQSNTATAREYRRKQQRNIARGHRPEWQQRYDSREVVVDKRNAAFETLKQGGIKKFRNFEFKNAIQDFTAALEYDARDVSLHFNLACCYSLQEEVDKAYIHLAQAVAYGFNDFNRILTHDALAYLRIQPTFPKFQENGYASLPKREKVEKAEEKSAVEEELSLPHVPNNDLLDEIRQLNSLKDLGLLSEEEFERQKSKLEA